MAWDYLTLDVFFKVTRKGGLFGGDEGFWAIRIAPNAERALADGLAALGRSDWELVTAQVAGLQSGGQRPSVYRPGYLYIFKKPSTRVDEPTIPGEPSMPTVSPSIRSGASTYAVRLLNAGSNKIQVIKVIRVATNLGLREAKELVDNAPSTVLHGLGRDKADDWVSQLRAAGASAAAVPE